jgi:tRNA nucleotidyltransferase (CCA-adding enzyme)
MALPERPSDFVRAVEGVPLLGLWALWRRLPSGDPLRERLKRYATHWRRVYPFTSGYDLKLRGLPPGAQYRAILWRLRAAWLDGEVASFEQEQALLEKLLRPFL